MLAVITKRDMEVDRKKSTQGLHILEIRSLGLSDSWWEGGSGGAMNDSEVLAGAMDK